jgi:hypothetical protein
MIATAVLADEAHANDLMSLYELAQQKDSTLQSATFQRDAAVETRSQALAHILPQVSATASTQLERATSVNSQSGAGPNLTGCTADITQICTGNVRTVGLSLSQTVWNYEAFNELKEGEIQASAAEATYRAARHGNPGSSVVIVSKPIADQLFPGGNALGQKVYQDGKPATIVGIVERLQTPMSNDSNGGWALNSVIEPLRADIFWPSYIVRARAGRSAEAMRDIRKALFAVNPMRHMPNPGAGIRLLSEARARHFGQERGIAVLMSVICVILLSVTAAGIVGLTSFWVGQRTRQIGVRRACGATKIHILRYFQIENLMIVGTGAMLGVLLAYALSEWLMAHYEVMHLPLSYVAKA